MPAFPPGRPTGCPFQWVRQSRCVTLTFLFEHISSHPGLVRGPVVMCLRIFIAIRAGSVHRTYRSRYNVFLPTFHHALAVRVPGVGGNGGIPHAGLTLPAQMR